MQKFLVATLASAALATPALAQESMVTGRQSTFSVTPYAGYMFFGELAETSPTSNLSNEDGFMFGAQAKIRMTSRWAVYGNAAYSKTQFEDEQDEGVGGNPISGDIGYFLGDLGLEYRLPFSFQGGNVGPFVQGGVGAVKYSPDSDDLNADGTTNVAFNVGAGIDFNVGPVGLQLMLKDYITSLDWDQVRNVDTNIDGDRVANNLALTLGAHINF